MSAATAPRIEPPDASDPIESEGGIGLLREARAISLRREPALLAFLALTACAPIARPPLFSFGGQAIQATDALLVVFYALIGWTWLRGERRPRFDRLFTATAIYIAVLALSLAVAGRLVSKDTLKLVAYCGYLLLPWSATPLFDSRPRLALVVWAWLAGMAITTFVGLFGFAAFYVHRPLGEALMCGYGSLEPGNYPRLCAPFRNQNMFMNYLVMGMPFVLLAFASRLRHAGPWVWLAAIGVIALFTMSGGLGGFAIAFAMMIVAVRRRRGLSGKLNAIVVAGAAAVALVMTASMLVEVVPSRSGEPAGPSWKLEEAPRPIIWQGVLPSIREHPLTGIGYGALVAEVTDPKTYMPAAKLKKVVGPLPPRRLEGHDIWLSVTGQAGFIGLAAFVLLLAEITRGWIWNVPRGAARALWRVALAAGFYGGFVYGGLFGALEEARHLWPFFALAASWGAVARASERVGAIAPVAGAGVELGGAVFDERS